MSILVFLVIQFYCKTIIMPITTTSAFFTETLYDIADKYENDKNSMLSITEKDTSNIYEDFYDELEIKIKSGPTMDILYFGPPDTFMRIGAESILHILVNTKKEFIPVNRVLQAWDIITDGKTAAFLQGREFLAFGSLLNMVPEEDLYYTNMGDASVLKYFANYKVGLHSRKIGVLVSAYRRYFGDSWYLNGTNVNSLGYLLCGFPPSDLRKISPAVIKELNADVLSKLERCTDSQVQTLYDIATHPDAYGDPYKWTSHEVNRLDSLFKCIPENDIDSLQLEAIPAITSSVMAEIAQRKLSFFTKQQVTRMQPLAQRMYILRTQLKYSLDVNELAKRFGTLNKPSIVLLLGLVCLTISK